MIEDSKLQERYAREEQKMGNENGEPNSGEVFRPRTAADLIQEAARVVNWRPDEKYSQQARYDAALALSSLYAYWTTVTLETLRRLDPAAAERVTSHIDDDLGWADAHEHAYGWEQALDAGKPIPSDAWPFWEILGRPDTQPAGGQHIPDVELGFDPHPVELCEPERCRPGEHHTGSLDLTGEGNAPEHDAETCPHPEGPCTHDVVMPGVTGAALTLAAEAFAGLPRSTGDYAVAQAILEAAVPAIRQQVAEEIAAAIEEALMGLLSGLEARSAAAAVAREIGGKA